MSFIFKKAYRNIFLLCLLFATSTYAASSADSSLTNNIRHEYVSPRALGMGDAFTAVADDHNVLFYNPAGLAFLTESDLNLKLQGGIADGTYNFTQDMKAALDKSTDSEKVSAVTTLLQNNYGKDYWLRPTIGGIYAKPRWGMAFIPIDFDLTLSLHQQVGPTLNVEAYQDSTLAFGYAWLMDQDKLGIGILPKAVYRAYVGKAVPAGEMLVNSEYFTKQDAQEGLTFDMDVGVMHKLNNWGIVKPTVSFVARNIVDYGFKQNLHLIDGNSASEPPTLGRRFDLGTAWEFPNWGMFSPKATLDMRDMGHKYWTWWKGLHMGAEFMFDAAWWARAALRGGFSQGYISAGGSVVFAWFRLDVATWGEEMGTSNARRQNRRYIFSASLDF